MAQSLVGILRAGGVRVMAVGAAVAVIAALPHSSLAVGRQVQAGPVSAGAASEYGGRVGHAVVSVRKSQVIEVGQPYATALIAEAEIADVVPLSDHSIYVLGKKAGSSRLTIVAEDQSIIKIVEVEVTPDIADLKAKLAENLPHAEIEPIAVNGGIVLNGTVLDASDVEKAVAIARRYAPDDITNALQVAGPQQVMLEVRFVEASRTASRELGMSTRIKGPSATGNTGDQFSDAASGILQTTALLSGGAPFGTMIARVLEGGTNVDLMIRALEERQLVRRLAEPNLVTTSGDTASFLAGGEFPFPVSASDNRISIEFKQFGVALAFTPTVLRNGLVNLRIAPEVSDIDPSNTVSVGSVAIPGLIVRRANTTVELRDGQSLAIAGLIKHGHTTLQSQLPWIGQVPVLGALFRSATFQKDESDLVIIVTPRLVKPKRPGELLKTPLDTPIAGNDVDFFVNGRSELTRADINRRREPKPFGHIISSGPEVAVHEAK